MSNPTQIKRRIDLLTVRELCRRAAKYKRLELKENDNRLRSNAIRTYTLTNEDIVYLASKGIKHHPRQDQVYTLCDENPQAQPVPGFTASNYWNFEIPHHRNQPEIQITLSVEFELRPRRRGIALLPRAYGGIVAPADDLPHYRMFRALVERDPDATLTMRELAASNGSVDVSWTDFGLGGLRMLDQLFEEFARNNEHILRLAKHSAIFKPQPYSNPLTMFVTEPDQPTLFDIWDEQLTNYRTSLERR